MDGSLGGGTEKNHPMMVPSIAEDESLLIRTERSMPRKKQPGVLWQTSWAAADTGDVCSCTEGPMDARSASQSVWICVFCWRTVVALQTLSGQYNKPLISMKTITDYNLDGYRQD